MAKWQRAKRVYRVIADVVIEWLPAVIVLCILGVIVGFTVNDMMEDYLLGNLRALLDTTDLQIWLYSTGIDFVVLLGLGFGLLGLSELLSDLPRKGQVDRRAELVRVTTWLSVGAVIIGAAILVAHGFAQALLSIGTPVALWWYAILCGTAVGSLVTIAVVMTAGWAADWRPSRTNRLDRLKYRLGLVK